MGYKASRDALICAFDTSDIGRARELADELKECVGIIKLASEFVTAHGPQGVVEIHERSGLPIFVDLKYHDIPNQVAGAIRSALRMNPRILTIHAQGGEAMIKAAVAAADDAEPNKRPLIAAVTVLTSLSQRDITFMGPGRTVADTVKAYANLARSCGVDAIVCSAHEIEIVREVCGDQIKLIVPGLRPPWVKEDDQARIMSPQEARAKGADYLVIGRPITQGGDPADCARRILEDISEGEKIRQQQLA